ncbi:unnamed protein product [Arctogadus glacialis]
MLRVMDELISGPAFASELGGGASPQALQSVILSSSTAAEGTAKTRPLRLPGPGVTIIESPSPVVGVQNVITRNEHIATMVPHCSINWKQPRGRPRHSGCQDPNDCSQTVTPLPLKPCGMVTLLRLPACAHPCHHGNSCPLPLLLAILNLHGLMEPCWQRHAS